MRFYSEKKSVAARGKVCETEDGGGEKGEQGDEEASYDDGCVFLRARKNRRGAGCDGKNRCVERGEDSGSPAEKRQKSVNARARGNGLLSGGFNRL